MNDEQMHADHIDETGAYGKRFEVVRNLIDTGVLTEIPQEFKKQSSIAVETVAVEPQSNFKFTDSNGNKHADHVDDTGEYKREFEKLYGHSFGNDGPNQVESAVETEWKSFLQKLIAEEKSKLNL